MSSKRNNSLLSLKIKRASLFFLGLTFFLFPGENQLLKLQFLIRPVEVSVNQIELPPLFPYPVNFNNQPSPSLTAHSALIMDKDSSVILFSKNKDLLVLPASTVKLMTALVALDYYSLNKILQVGKLEVWGQTMGLQEGEEITVENLLKGLLIASANDAALVLAQNYPGGLSGFVAMMNQKAAHFNLQRTYFANPTGIDSNKEGKILADFSYTTALDLARLMVLAIKTPPLLEIMEKKEEIVTDVTGKIIHKLLNINQLLGKIEGLKGGKTGWTEEAGECLVSYIERDGRGIIIVVLGSKDRFGETAHLAEWAFSNFHWINLDPSIYQPPLSYILKEK